MIRSTLHRIGATCFVRIKPRDIRTDWLVAVVVAADPLTAEIIAPHPIWRGCQVTRNDDADIRVDPKRWPKLAERTRGAA